MRNQEEKILLSILNNLHVRYEFIPMDNAADYTPILESIIEGIMEGIATKKQTEEIERKRQKLYSHAREFILELCLRHEDYEEDLDRFIDSGTVWIDSKSA
ncbi:hypothetical protein [Candidatus Electrothrix sp.]